jgi:hypothetical protein
MMTKKILIFGWILFRLILLNALILTGAFTLAILRYFFEPITSFVIQFPFQLYVAALFLTNFVYIIGNIFESIYRRLWEKEIEIREFEKRFFKAGLIVIAIVNIYGIIIYFIAYFS